MATCAEGHQNTDGSVYCNTCGRALAEEPVESPNSISPVNAATAASSRGKPGRMARALLVVVAAVVVVCGGIAVGMNLSNDDDDQSTAEGGPPSQGDQAGPPFSPEVQSALASLANQQGWTLEVDGETGQCEVLNRIVEHMPVEQPVVLTEENAEAATGPNGSLFITISSWTDGNDEALRAVQSCTDYFVGTTAGRY